MSRLLRNILKLLAQSLVQKIAPLETSPAPATLRTPDHLDYARYPEHFPHRCAYCNSPTAMGSHVKDGRFYPSCCYRTACIDRWQSVAVESTAKA